MRVISGTAKGMRLRAPRGAKVRPTADHVRQALFDILGQRCTGLRVLDLFAGSGALGIEALSRGAAEAVFVESDPAAVRAILANLGATGLGELASVRRADAVRFVARPPREPFDLLFLDPPYERGLAFVARVLAKLVPGGWIRPGGTVVAEAEAGELDLPAPLRETRTRRFGRTQITVAVLEDAGTRSAKQ
jgi:16S rRNA (guanine966-N2)-methyltransferase